MAGLSPAYAFPYPFLAAGLSLIFSNGGRAAHPGAKPFSRLSALILLTLLLQSLAHLLFSALYPLERTGIYFLPLFILLFSLSLEVTLNQKWPSFRSFIGQGLLILLLIGNLSNFRSDHFRGREYDARSKAIYEALRDTDIQRNTAIGVNWLLEPSLNFYRSFFGDSFVPRFTRQSPSPTDELFILLPDESPEDRRLLSEQSLHIIFEEPFSGAIIATNR